MFDADERTWIVPAAAHARATANSPSGCASLLNPHGASITGIEIGVPRTVVAVLIVETSTPMRLRQRTTVTTPSMLDAMLASLNEPAKK